MVELAHRFDDSTAYERLMGRWSRAVGVVFLDWVASPADARWLDVGCGLAFHRVGPRHVLSRGGVRRRPSGGTESYRRWRIEYGPNWEAKFREKYEDQMINKFDTHFYVGTVHQHPGSWIIVGLGAEPVMES